MPTPPLPLPGPLRNRAFTVARAAAMGATQAQLRGPGLTAPHRGVRTDFPSTDLGDRCRELGLVLGADQAFSHSTAARLWRIPLPAHVERDRSLHMVTIGSDRTVRRPGVVGHRTRSTDVHVVDILGNRVLDPVSTWLTLGSMLQLDDLIIAGDALVGELRLATIEGLRHALDRHPGIRGARTLRAALAEVRVGSRSAMETRVRLVLTRNGLPEPALNHDVYANGRWVACVDLAYPDARVSLEYDSDMHRTDPDAYRKDLTRSERLKDADWWPIRVTAYDVGRGEREFVARVRRVLAVGLHGSHRP